MCGGVTGAFVFRDNRWVLENEAELAVLVGLGGSSDGAGCLRGIAAALNAGAAGPGDVARLNRGLRSIADTEPAWRAHVPDDLMAAAAVACARWAQPKATQWLCWALSARLGHNLSEAGVFGPGRLSFHRRTTSPRFSGHDRDTGWLRWVGAGFWERLASHKDPLVREVAEASDPDAPPGRLEELGRSIHDEVLDLVASHPNTPEKTLNDLIAFDDWDREFPDMLLVFRVAQNLAVSPQFLHQMVDGVLNDGISYLLVHHPNIMAETLGHFDSSPCDVAAPWIASHPDTPKSAFESLIAEEDYDDGFPTPGWKTRKAAASNPGLPAELVAKLAGDRHFEVRASAASNPNLAQEQLAELAGDRRREVRAAAAANPRLPEGLLVQLAADRCAAVRAAAADNHALPEELLGSLAADGHRSVRRAIARSERAPAAVFASLASDSDIWVRWLLASNPAAPGDALVRLAGDPDEYVRQETARNPSSPAEVLIRLADDPDEWVRASVAPHPSAPAKALVRLAGDPERRVRASVARHPSTPARVLVGLAADPDPSVRGEVAGNPSAPAGVLEQIADDHHPFVLERAARNPSAPDSVLERLAQKERAGVFHPALESLSERRQQGSPYSTTTGRKP